VTRFYAGLFLYFSSFSLQGQINMALLSQRDQHGNNYANIWGYTDSQGREYALIGCYDGTAIYNISDPANPIEIDYISAPASSWHEIQVWDHYAYVVSEGGHGLQIINLSQLPDTAFLVKEWTTANFTRAHDLHVRDGYVYMTGGNTTAGAGQANIGGIKIVSLADPENPVEAGNWGINYVHDCYVRNDTIYAASIYQGIVYIIDVKNKSTPTTVYSYSYPNGFTHNAALTDDGQFLFTTDETSSPAGKLRIWDISTLRDGIAANTNITQVAEFGSTGIVHNVYVKGNYAYASYYTEGVRIWDVRNPKNPILVGHYDTYPSSNDPNYAGDWGVYPFFSSGRIILSDMQSGLFVLSFNPPPAGIVSGIIRDSVTGTPISGASVSFSGKNYTSTTGANGKYLVNELYAGLALNVMAAGYANKQIPIDLNSPNLSLDVSLIAAEGVVFAPPRIATSVFQNPAVSQYADIIVISQDSLQGAPLVRSKIGSDSTTISMTALPGFNSKGFTGSVKFTVSGSYSIYTKATSSHNKDSIQIHSFNVTLGKKGQSLIMKSIDGTCLLKVGNENLKEDTYFTTFEDKTGAETIYRFGPDREFSQDVRVEINYDGAAIPNVQKLFVFQKEGNSWMRRDTQVLPHEHMVKSNVNRLGEFKLFYDPTYSENDIVVDDFNLLQNYPNPFNPATTIGYQLATEAQIRIKVYNILGQEIRTLVNERQGAGFYRVIWDGKNNAGQAVSSGIYLYRMETSEIVRTRKMLYIK